MSNLVETSKQASPANAENDGCRDRSGIWNSAWLHTIALMAIVLFCFGRTLGSYFLADDFGHIGYLATACHGHWGMLWSNFTGNFMQIPGMNVYRPWQMINEACDWLLFHANASGYYATNLAYFAGCVVLLYFVSGKLFSQWGTQRSGAAAFLAAALFAANPLRCESVSWMVGRVDIVAGFFYLLALLVYITRSSMRWRIIGAVSFLLALLTKEMPVGLPILVVAACLTGATSESSSLPHQLLAKLTAAFRHTALLWSVLIGYFVVRTACLGTVTGGYVGGFGVASMTSFVQKWLDPDTIHRLFFPFNFAVLSEPNIYSKVLACCYGALAALIIVRLLAASIPWRHCLLLCVWMATAAAPIYQLWGLGYNLEGSRFYFFLCMPLALLLSALVFAPYSFSSANKDRDVLDRRLTIFGATALIIVAGVMMRITAMTNAAWVNAGKEVHRFADACAQLAQEHPSGQIVILGIPKERDGAHQILNGITFNTMLAPPFRKTHMSDRFINFAPVMFGRDDLIDTSRFRACVEDHLPIYVWTDAKELLALNVATQDGGNAPQPLSLQLSNAHAAPATFSGQTVGHAELTQGSQGIVLTNVQSDDGLSISGLHILPWQYDFLQFDATVTNGSPGADIRAVWSTANERVNLSLVSKNYMDGTIQESNSATSGTVKHYHVSVPLSHSWRWFTQPAIGNLLILPGSAQRTELRNLRLVSSASVAPLVSVVGATADNAGIVSTRGKQLTLSLNRPAAGAAAYQIQIGKPNFFLDNFDQANASTAIAQEFLCPVKDGSLTLSGNRFNQSFPMSGYYQVRARSCSATHTPVGEFSDLLTLSVKR